ncbi:MAG TPA: carboxypeptidase-like regulatory domain-containing protein, partial [Solirubrobacterales bacterium]|nr:carboxypeptidase-like regulatory domain-containing protein [Solirubrobacterales bacterium]
MSAGGSPVSGAVVEALDVSTSAVLASDTTGAGGSFSMTVSASSVDVRVTPPSGSGLQISTIHAVDTTSNANLEIILVPTASQVQLSGTLRDEHGNPVANGIVQLSSGPYVYTDAAGHYSFTMMPPGTYALYVYGDNLPGLPAHWSFYKPGVDMSADRV